MREQEDFGDFEKRNSLGKKKMDWEKEKNEYKKIIKKLSTDNTKLMQRCKSLEDCLSKYRDLETPEHIVQSASKHCTPHQLSFIEAQLFNSTTDDVKQWSGQMRDICRGLYFESPSGYKFMSQVLAMPTEDEIKEWTICAEHELPPPNSPPRDESDAVLEAEAILDEIAFEQLMSTVI